VSAPPAGAAGGPGGGASAPAARAAAFARRHWVFLALLAAGTALRVVTLLAYRPALIYFDSTTYLDNAEDLEPRGVRPLGYPLFLRLLPLEDELAVVPLVQHAMGLGIALALYALLVRLGVRPWLAALGAAPVLLDAYQLNIEEYILSETLYEALLVGGIVLVLWHRRPGLVLPALAGLLFAGAAITRASALLLFVPAVIALVLLARRPWPALALVAAFAVPVVGYMAWVDDVQGRFGITTYGGRFLYARVAPFADCRGLDIPAYQRPMCPRDPRMTVEEYMWSKKRSPVFDVELPEGRTRPEVAGEFARAVIRHQPLDYAREVTQDFFRAFSPVKNVGEGELPVSRWQFQLEFPVYREEVTEALRAHGDVRGRVDRDLASLLRRYQRIGYTPGPVLAIGLVLAALAALGAGRARRSGLQVACGLFVAMALAAYVPSVAVNQFTWRYQLPLVVLLVPALALAITALRGRPGAGREPAAGRDGALRVTDTRRSVAVSRR
jgi:hypothetical protein